MEKPVLRMHALFAADSDEVSKVCAAVVLNSKASLSADATAGA